MWNPQKTFLEAKRETTQGMQWIRQKEIVGENALIKAQSIIDQQGPEKLRLTTLTISDQLKRPKLWLAA
ncbi:MAG TPA: hypothetical protein DIU37_02180, partial [Opitutae bacterium]|nr:hypothetical protein [Opitutae bacterium]